LAEGGVKKGDTTNRTLTPADIGVQG
jgi:hypothetical protein